MHFSTIRQIKVDHIVYYHVELEQHDVILAEGLAAETYLDVGDRHIFSGDVMTAPGPDFPARLREMAGCAPIVLTGQKLQAIRFRLAGRAGRMFPAPGAIRRPDVPAISASLYCYDSGHKPEIRLQH